VTTCVYKTRDKVAVTKEKGYYSCSEKFPRQKMKCTNVGIVWAQSRDFHTMPFFSLRRSRREMCDDTIAVSCLLESCPWSAYRHC